MSPCGGSALTNSNDVIDVKHSNVFIAPGQRNSALPAPAGAGSSHIMPRQNEIVIAHAGDAVKNRKPF